ncbi:transposable element Tcb1 transposase [Trichonephila clavipes]|nr:transposable element Tcb1 transposase [Trichonephila clavipes]
MVWEAIAYDSRSTLIEIRGTLTGQRYVDDILRPHVGPFLNGLPGALFEQDNARPHTARVAEDFLRPFQTLPWPTRSPRFVPCSERVGSAKWADAIVSLLTGKMSHRGIRAHFEQLSEFERGRINEQKEAGWTNRRIACHMGRSDAAIRRCWQEWVENDRFQRYEGSG